MRHLSKSVEYKLHTSFSFTPKYIRVCTKNKNILFDIHNEVIKIRKLNIDTMELSHVQSKLCCPSNIVYSMISPVKDSICDQRFHLAFFSLLVSFNLEQFFNLIFHGLKDIRPFFKNTGQLFFECPCVQKICFRLKYQGSDVFFSVNYTGSHSMSLYPVISDIDFDLSTTCFLSDFSYEIFFFGNQ